MQIKKSKWGGWWWNVRVVYVAFGSRVRQAVVEIVAKSIQARRGPCQSGRIASTFPWPIAAGQCVSMETIFCLRILKLLPTSDQIASTKRRRNWPKGFIARLIARRRNFRHPHVGINAPDCPAWMNVLRNSRPSPHWPLKPLIDITSEIRIKVRAQNLTQISQSHFELRPN